MKRFVLVVLVLLTLTGLGACETLKGAGRDIQAGGQALDDAVSK